MPRLDRLSSLMSRFKLSVTPTGLSEANLVIFADKDTGLASRVLLSPLGQRPLQAKEAESVMFSAKTRWGGTDNPLFSALPDIVELAIDRDDEMAMLGRLLKAESESPRCGGEAVLNRLGEVLMVRLLRSQIAQGPTGVGLLGGLADERLSKCIVAIHEEPGKPWRNEELADIAHLSRSRFSELFLQRVGETPQAYLRRWRMILARQDVERGERIQQVAERYGYGSSEALSRAFKRQFGENPVALRSAVSH